MLALPLCLKLKTALNKIKKDKYKQLTVLFYLGQRIHGHQYRELVLVF